jgi:uncharacterized protein YcbK (DUF882 family)
MKVSENFSREEFKCKCKKCDFATVDVELIDLLEKIRSHFGDNPVTINSACRCENHNDDVGGSKGSKHKQGIAADIDVKGIHPLKVYGFVDSISIDRYGIGHYPTFTHVDVRPDKARWHG